MNGSSAVVLGLSSGFHDSAACLLVDGEVVAAVEQERLTRIKHDSSFPDRAASCCLAIAGLGADEVDVVAYHEKPLAVLDRHLRSRTRYGPFALGGLISQTPDVVHEQLTVGSTIDRWFRAHDADPPPVQYVEHHTSHAAGAFYTSPFQHAAVLTVDGVGEWASSTIASGFSNRLEVQCEQRFPDSLGLLYSAFTGYCGFRVNGGEGELMGLAPFGSPVYADLIWEHLVDRHDDGSFSLDQRYFAFAKGRRMTNRRFASLFGGPALPPGSPVGRREADLAASVQAVAEELLLDLARAAVSRTGMDDLCLSGGVALNCVANGRLLREGPVRRIWVPPAPGDSGSAVGAALWLWHHHLGRPRQVDPRGSLGGAFLGPSFGQDEIEGWLRGAAIDHEVLPSSEALESHVAGLLADGKVVGWFRGRMEFGPRALGHRSILADPRSPTVKQRLNDLVKERASFRPFAPAVLADRVGEWFEEAGESPFMNVVTHVLPSLQRSPDDGGTSADGGEGEVEVRAKLPYSDLPAVTHVDHSARIQTVDADRNPELHGLLSAFDRITGCPVLLNTSFNSRDEPIVCTPDDAHRTFRRTGLDVLVLERCVIGAES